MNSFAFVSRLTEEILLIINAILSCTSELGAYDGKKECILYALCQCASNENQV